MEYFKKYESIDISNYKKENKKENITYAKTDNSIVYFESELICKDGKFYCYYDNNDNYNNNINNIMEVENNRGIHGDKVIIKITNNVNDSFNSQRLDVINVIKRNNSHIVGILSLNQNQKYGFTKKGIPLIKFTPLSRKFPTFMVPCKNKERFAIYTAISFNKWDITNKMPIGKIEKIIGKIGDFKNEEQAILYKHYLSAAFKKKSQRLLKFNTFITSKSDNIYNTFSIDPPGCLDIDDAIHIKLLNSNDTDSNDIELGIHIADVASYLKEYDNDLTSKLDFNFFSTVYLNEEQINMLPNNASYDISSIGNGEIKKAVSLICNYTKENGVYILKSYKFSQVHVKNKAMTYSDIDSILDKIIKNKQQNITNIVNPSQEYKNIKLLLELFNDIDSNSNLPVKSTKIVEFFMLLYNKLLAETLYSYDHHTILRRQTVSEMALSSSYLNLNLNLNTELVEYLERKNNNAADYVIGSNHNFEELQHSSLSVNLYTHATSPIRRYVDIVNQINIINYIQNKPMFKISQKMIEKINNFNKNLRRFYNNYKKLNLIYKLNKCDSADFNSFNAYIISISKFKLKIYIPSLDISHNIRFITKDIAKNLSNIKYLSQINNKSHLLSYKEIDKTLLLNKQMKTDTINTINTEFEEIHFNNIILRKHDKIIIEITILKSEPIFNKKLYCKIVEPCIDLF